MAEGGEIEDVPLIESGESTPMSNNANRTVFSSTSSDAASGTSSPESHFSNRQQDQVVKTFLGILNFMI